MNIKEIINNDKMLAFLKGEDGYEIVNKYVDMPTDPTIAMGYIKRYYEETNDEQVWTDLEKSLFKLAEDKHFIYMLPVYIGCSLSYTLDNPTKHLQLDELIDIFSKKVNEYSDFLKDNKDGIGFNYEGGILGYIQSINSQIKMILI